MFSDLTALQQIIESSAECIMIVDAQGLIQYVNPSGERLFGYAQAELVGQKIEILVPMRTRGVHEQHREQYFHHPKQRSMGKGIDLYGVRKEGHEFPIEVSLSHTEINGKHIAIAFIIDITSRKRQEDLLQKSKERLDYFVNLTPVPVAMTDKQLHYLLVSSAWQNQFGKGETLIGKNHLTTFPSHQPHWEKAYAQALQGHIITRDEEEVNRPDGSSEWFRWEVHPWRDDAGQIGGVILYFEDITKRKIAEIALRQSRGKLKKYTQELERSNKELENFAYVASHDLQEPLRKIQTFGDRLRSVEGERLSERGKDYLVRMLNSASRMQVLINDLLSFSRISTKNNAFRAVDLNAIIRDVLSDMEVAIEKTKALIEYTELPELEGDPTQLRQVFQNLISNSLKFIQDGKQPIVQIRWEKNGEQPEAENLAFITVQDNGIGFDEKFIDKIFTIFQRLEGSKYPGSGIGLAVVKKICQRHGGDIMAKSSVGNGAIFTIKLPFRQYSEFSKADF